MILSSIAPAPDFLAQESAREWLARHGAERLVPDGALFEAGALVERGDRLTVRLLVDGSPVAGPALVNNCACGAPLPRHHQQCIPCLHGVAACRACGAEVLARYRYCFGCAHALAARYSPAQGTWKGGPGWMATCPYGGCDEPTGQGQMLCAAHWKVLPQVYKVRFVSLLARDHRGPAWEEGVAELVELACHAVSEQLMLSYQEKR